MSLTGGLVLYSVIWFLALFISLQVGHHTQGDAGEVVPGTPASAPADFNLKKRLLWVTVWTTVVWAVIAGIIISGVIGIEDIDFWDHYNPPE